MKTILFLLLMQSSLLTLAGSITLDDGTVVQAFPRSTEIYITKGSPMLIKDLLRIRYRDTGWHPKPHESGYIRKTSGEAARVHIEVPADLGVIERTVVGYDLLSTGKGGSLRVDVSVEGRSLSLYVNLVPLDFGGNGTGPNSVASVDDIVSSLGLPDERQRLVEGTPEGLQEAWIYLSRPSLRVVIEDNLRLSDVVTVEDKEEPFPPPASLSDDVAAEIYNFFASEGYIMEEGPCDAVGIPLYNGDFQKLRDHIESMIGPSKRLFLTQKDGRYHLYHSLCENDEFVYLSQHHIQKYLRNLDQGAPHCSSSPVSQKWHSADPPEKAGPVIYNRAKSLGFDRVSYVGTNPITLQHLFLVEGCTDNKIIASKRLRREVSKHFYEKGLPSLITCDRDSAESATFKGTLEEVKAQVLDYAYASFYNGVYLESFEPAKGEYIFLFTKCKFTESQMKEYFKERLSKKRIGDGEICRTGMRIRKLTVTGYALQVVEDVYQACTAGNFKSAVLRKFDPATDTYKFRLESCR